MLYVLRRLLTKLQSLRGIDGIDRNVKRLATLVDDLIHPALVAALAVDVLELDAEALVDRPEPA